MSTSDIEEDCSSGWITKVVRFHGFADLSTARGVSSSQMQEFSCFGHQWSLDIYPGGFSNATSEGFSSVFLHNKSKKFISIQWGCSVRDANNKEVVYDSTHNHEFAASDHDTKKGRHISCSLSFAKRSTLLELLVNGSLLIEVRMKKPSSPITHFIPTNPFNKFMLELFMDEETADVLFEIGGEQQTKGSRRKRAKTSTANFHAHRLILQKCAPTLYEMCRGSDGGEISTVSITDVKPEIFKHMIYYTYGGKLSSKDLKDNAKDIIDACDKYGVVNLKLEAEACYVKSTKITMDNMMDNLLYADSKNLALLKEAVMDYIVKNKTTIISKVSFDNFPSHLVTDLLTAVARGEDQSRDDEEEDESARYVKMRVGTLRKMLDEKGLDVDGSTESMIALLKGHNSAEASA